MLKKKNWTGKKILWSLIGGFFLIFGVIPAIFSNEDSSSKLQESSMLNKPVVIASETLEPTNTKIPTDTQVPLPTKTRVIPTATYIPTKIVYFTPTLKPINTSIPQATGCPNGCTYHPVGCDIKGNISYNTGEKIYHLVGMNFYNDTAINPNYGEKWFCTEQEAINNGWRKAKN